MKPHFYRTFAVSALCSLTIAGCAAKESYNTAAAPSRYLYVWAGTGHDSTRGVDMVTVLDANPASAGYGGVIAALTVDSSGLMPHHTEVVLPAKGPLFANDYNGDKSYMIDFSDPVNPRSDGRIAAVPGGRKVHSFDRLPNGNVLATYQFGDGTLKGDPGGLVEFDSQGKLVRSSSSRDPAFPDSAIRTYALAVLPKIDRVVTTSSPMELVRT